MPELTGTSQTSTLTTAANLEELTNLSRRSHSENCFEDNTHFWNPSSRYNYNHDKDQQQQQQQQMDDKGGDGVQVYKTTSREIKAVRVHLDYSRSPTNEQAPRSRMARKMSGGTGGPSSETSSDVERASAAVNDLKADRVQSFKTGKRKSSVKSNKREKEDRHKMSTRTKKLVEESNLADDEGNGTAPNQFNFFFATMLLGISYYYIVTLMVIVAWSCVCVWYVEKYRLIADENPTVKQWLGWLDEIDVSMIGSLFVFSLVFRFNQCYNRWWQGRMLWGDIIQNCLDFSRKSTLWIVNREYSDRMNRYIVCLPYAAKAQLRGLSLTDETESGQALVDRGFLAQGELDFLRDNPCWEPDFFLDLMRAVIAKVILLQWEREPDEQYLVLPHSNRIHDRLFPPLEKAVSDLGDSIGEGVSVRSAGLPRSYDTVHYVFFWIYFLLAPPAEAAKLGWLAPILLGFLACIIMTLMDMGTAMVDPFGNDLVDLPIERFCETIEAQVMTIQRRHNTSAVMEFASSSTPGKKIDAERFHNRRSTVLDLVH